MSRKQKLSRSFRDRGPNSTMNSSLGTNHEVDLEMDMDIVELDAINHPSGMDLGTLSTAVGGDDGEPIHPDDFKSEGIDLDYSHPALEHGFRNAPSLDNIKRDIRGIRVNVEKSTTTM